jgi:hypothetical protein
MPKGFAHVTDRQLLEWAATMPLERIAEVCGWTTCTLSRRLQALGWTPTERLLGDPTEEEIRQRCEEVRSRWSRTDPRLRAGRVPVSAIDARVFGLGPANS